VDDLTSIQQDLELSLQKYEEKLTQLCRSVQDLIGSQEPKYFAKSTTDYQIVMRRETASQILERTRVIDPEMEKLLCDRLNTYTNWQYPGMVIRPAHCVGLDSLVAFDPLYMVDTDEDLLSPIRSLFTPVYQNRLRYYVIQEYVTDSIFWNLPQSQFGFIYAFNYFESKPWEIIKQYFTEIFVLLRPGGGCLFSFNDCDHWSAVRLVECNLYCYTPGHLVMEYIQKLGFKIIHKYTDQTGLSWMEICKPGALTSIRGGQALAVIFTKPEPEVIDIPIQQLYNELDLAMLIELSEVLKVDISQDKTKRDFNIKKVRRTISAYLESANYPEEYLRTLLNQRKNK
jgi:SAM-dependent methyltransferase